MGNVLALICQVWLDYKVGRDLRINNTTTKDSVTAEKEAEDQAHDNPTTTSSCVEEPGLTNETPPSLEIAQPLEGQQDVTEAAIECKKEAEDQVPDEPTSTSSSSEEPGSTPEKGSSTEITHGQAEQQHATPKAATKPKNEKQSGWRRSQDPHAESPWRDEFFIDGESTWRGTWVLEVKDLRALDWEIERVAKTTGRGGTYVRKMTRQWPFPPPGQREEPLGGEEDDLMAFLGRP